MVIKWFTDKKLHKIQNKLQEQQFFLKIATWKWQQFFFLRDKIWVKKTRSRFYLYLAEKRSWHLVLNGIELAMKHIQVFRSLEKTHFTNLMYHPSGGSRDRNIQMWRTLEYLDSWWSGDILWVLGISPTSEEPVFRIKPQTSTGTLERRDPETSWLQPLGYKKKSMTCFFHLYADDICRYIWPWDPMKKNAFSELLDYFNGVKQLLALNYYHETTAEQNVICLASHLVSSEPTVVFRMLNKHVKTWTHHRLGCCQWLPPHLKINF